jgi:hypothetical protein
MIGLSKVTQSTDNAAIIIKEQARSRINDSTSRISRSGTLDGGSHIEHLGYSDGDRKFEIFTSLEKTKADNIWAFYKSETMINISCLDGFFYGAIENLKIDNGIMRMTLLIKE